jgi:hypothetical protein
LKEKIMAITKTWTIEGVTVLTNLFELQNVIRTINWKLTVQNDGGNSTPPQIVYVNGSVTLALPEQTTFVPYETLTEEQMISWVKEELGSKAIAHERQAEDHVLSTLVSSSPETMVIESKSLPWA